jgi:hypothetical protein
MFSTEGQVAFSFGGMAATRRAGIASELPQDAGYADIPVLIESPARDMVKQDRKSVIARLLDAMRDNDEICCTD